MTYRPPSSGRRTAGAFAIALALVRRMPQTAHTAVNSILIA